MKLKNMLSKAVKTIEIKIPILGKVVIGALVGSIIVMCFSLYATVTENRINGATVMIMRMTGGGGTGVVISNSPSESRILTNNHVCEAIRAGGKVRSSSGKEHLVSTITQSQLHDICLVTVQADLGTSAKIASKAQATYSPSSISGHPNLLPAVVSKGHVSSNQIIGVFMGVRACNNDEKAEEQSSMICMFFGGMPVIRTFDALLITAMIMPGSSGSAVYNADGELAGLAFAGSQGLSYAYTVPYEYMKNFLDVELNRLDTEILNYEASLLDMLQAQNKSKSYYTYIRNKCNNAPKAVEAVCATMVRDINFRELAQ